MSLRTSSLCSCIFLVFRDDHGLKVVNILKIEFRSCARGRQWCGIIHYHWWTASIKPRLLFFTAGYASWGLFLSSVLFCLHFLRRVGLPKNTCIILFVFYKKNILYYQLWHALSAWCKVKYLPWRPYIILMPIKYLYGI